MNGIHEKAIIGTDERLVRVETDVVWIKKALEKTVNRLPIWATAIIGLLTATVGWLM